MAWLRAVMSGSISKKLISGATGLGLFAFVAVHLTGNLTLFLGAEAFNSYAHFLETFLHGAFIYIAEAGLILFFVAHIASGVSVAVKRRKVRPNGYAVRGNAGGPSRKSISSRSMLISGTLLLVYVVLHVRHFKFGPSYETTIHGETVRDLYRLVAEEFARLPVVAAYVGAMLFLGLHLRHGFWSMFQSLGALDKRLAPAVVALGTAVAGLLTVGFIILPIWMYFFGDPSAGTGASAGVDALAASALLGGGR